MNLSNLTSIKMAYAASALMINGVKSNPNSNVMEVVSPATVEEFHEFTGTSANAAVGAIPEARDITLEMVLRGARHNNASYVNGIMTTTITCEDIDIALAEGKKKKKSKSAEEADSQAAEIEGLNNQVAAADSKMYELQEAVNNLTKLLEESEAEKLAIQSKLDATATDPLVVNSDGEAADSNDDDAQEDGAGDDAKETAAEKKAREDAELERMVAEEDEAKKKAEAAKSKK